MEKLNLHRSISIFVISAIFRTLATWQHTKTNEFDKQTHTHSERRRCWLQGKMKPESVVDYVSRLESVVSYVGRSESVIGYVARSESVMS